MIDAFKVNRDFEAALCEYTGAPYCVVVNSCTSALLLCLDYLLNIKQPWGIRGGQISIPKRTYVSVPMQVLNVGWKVKFREEQWSGLYQLEPIPLWDAARRFTEGMFNFSVPHKGGPRFICPSFHWSKILGVQQGGAILHNDPEADPILRRMRFDGRTEGVAPKDDTFPVRGWHAYMAPEIAAEGLVRLSFLPKENPDLPWSDYPDLSTFPIFGACR